MRTHLQSQVIDVFDLYEALDVLINQNKYELEEKYLTVDLREYLIFQLNKLKEIRQHLKKDLRFNYLFLQESIDKLYAIDSNLTGVNIVLTFKEVLKQNENLAYLKFNILKESRV